MASNRALFFATAQDLSAALSLLESAKDLQYAEGGLFKSDHIDIFASHGDIPDFGKATHPAAIANSIYLIAFRKTPIHSRSVPQEKGGVRFAVDQSMNRDTVDLQPGGSFGDNVILYGTVGNVSPSPVAKTLFRLVTKALRTSFTPQDGYLIGPEARDRWNAGARLTIGADSPPEFDLRRA